MLLFNGILLFLRKEKTTANLHKMKRTSRDVDLNDEAQNAGELRPGVSFIESIVCVSPRNQTT